MVRFETVKELVDELKNKGDKRNPVGGVDRTDTVDKISLMNAIETPFWMAVWATEPQRRIFVEMSYDDLKIICDLIDKERERNNDLTEG